MATAFILALAFRGQAANLTWDANGASGTPPHPADGSGDWQTGNGWWNGSADIPWANFNGAIFGTGSGTAGTYSVSIGTPVLVTNLVFQAPGVYDITGTQITLSNVVSAGLTVSAGVTAEVDAFINGPAGNSPAVNYSVGAGSTLILNGGGITIGGGGANWTGSSFSTSTIILGGGTVQQQGSFNPDNITLDITNGAVFNDVARFDIARTGAAVVNVSSGGQLNANTAANAGSDDTANLQVSRSNPGTLNVLNGGIISGTEPNNTRLGGNITVLPDSSSRAILNVFPGGAVKAGIGPNGQVGVSSILLRSIRMVIAQSATTYSANALAIANISGGTIAAANIVFGSSSGVYTANPTNQLNISGGMIYLDAGSISQPVNTGTNFGINLSGATIAATANWSPACSVSMNLTNINGNITFQAADLNGTPFNMPISGKLTGVGGLNKTGGGVLTLSGANTFTGNTVVSNGTLVINTGGFPTNGNVTIDGSAVAFAGLPTNGVTVANPGQFWTIGNLTYAAGTPTAEFNFGSLPPSSTVAPIQAMGNVICTVTPQIKLDGSAIPTGTYPMIHYGGSVAGTLPVVPILPTGASGYVSNSVSDATIYVVVTNSLVTPSLVWGVGNGTWDFTSFDWLLFGNSTNYADGKPVVFDNTASGTSPITITDNLTVQPSSVTFNNSTKAYVIQGSGTITGPASVDIKGTAPVTLSGKNTYTGGTTIEAGAGPLNIAYGGDNTGANSAIGTGSLTINLGGKIDNTSGSPLTLMPNNIQFWNDDFIFAGSSSLNMGLGQVTLGSGSVNITVSNNTLTVSNQITDNGMNFGIGKSGAGTLTLANNNTFAGGTTLNAGQLNINSGGDSGPDSAIGTGTFTILGGTVDNTSGSALTIQTPVAEAWNAPSFTFNGSSDLDLGVGDINLNVGDVILNVVGNSLISEGSIGGHNKNIIKQGAGTLVLGGNLNDNNGLGVMVNSGTLLLNKVSNGSSHAIGVGTDGLFVNSNALTIITGSGGDQINDAAPVQLNGGGVLDLNGQSETVNTMTISNGILRNSAAVVSTFRPWGGGSNMFTLNGSYGQIDITNGGGIIENINIFGSAQLLFTGLGTLTLSGTNTYTGNTIISNGTVALTAAGLITSSSNIFLASSTSALDLGTSTFTNGAGVPILTLASGEELSGFGTVTGAVVAAGSSKLAVGSAQNIGVLTISSNTVLNGTTMVKVDKGNAVNDVLSVGGGLIYGGTLVVTNLSGTLNINDSFPVFTAANGFTGNFTSVQPAIAGPGLAWDISTLATDGRLRLKVGVAMNSTNITISVSGNTMTLSWPSDHLGWHLQVQTNSLATGLGTNWVTIPGTDQVTSTNITINPASGTSFYRMISP